MKRSVVHAGRRAALLVGVTACGGGEATTSPPVHTGGATPSATTTSQPPPTATATTTDTSSGSDTLAAKSTYTYGGLTLVVNLPANIPTASRSSLRLFSEFLQAVGRTMARNKLDPSLSGLASTDVVKYVQTFTDTVSVEGIGWMVFTVSNVHTLTSGYAVMSGCMDQSKLVSVRKDGSHHVDPNASTYPTLKMKADINPVDIGRKITNFAYAVGAC